MTQYTPQAQHPVSMDDRIKALAVARETLVGNARPDPGSMAAMFGSGGPTKSLPADGSAVTSLIRLAEYVAVGHDYLDTHQDTPAEDVKSAIVNVVVEAVEHRLEGVEFSDEVAAKINKMVKKAARKEAKRELDKRGYE